MHAKVDRVSGKPTWDRAFCIRMKSTLTKRGCHFKSSGYRVKICLKPSQNKKDQNYVYWILETDCFLGLLLLWAEFRSKVRSHLLFWQQLCNQLFYYKKSSRNWVREVDYSDLFKIFLEEYWNNFMWIPKQSGFTVRKINSVRAEPDST